MPSSIRFHAFLPPALIALGFVLAPSIGRCDTPEEQAAKILREDGFWDIAASTGFFRHQGGPVQLPVERLQAAGSLGGMLGIGTLTEIRFLHLDTQFKEADPGESEITNVFHGPALIQRMLWEFNATYAAADGEPRLTVARTVKDLEAARRAGRLAVVLGLDTGAEIDEDLRALQMYQRIGLRKLALVHAVGTSWADSVTSKRAGPGGLSDFGRQVVKECNRLGIMVDLSHSSDQTFWDALAVSTKPLIATHSGSRAVSKFNRNLTDDMLRALAAKGGMVGVCGLFDEAEEKKREGGPYYPDILAIGLYLAAKYPDPYQLAAASSDPKEQAEAIRQLRLDPSKEYAYPGEHMDVPEKRAVIVRVLLDHLDHIVGVMGIDHVGIGTDLNQARAGYPELIREIVAGLVRRGYAREQIQKILYGNFYRYFATVTAGTPSDPRD